MNYAGVNPDERQYISEEEKREGNLSEKGLMCLLYNRPFNEVVFCGE